MARYVLVDNETGTVMADIDAADPVAAVKASDCRLHDVPPTYTAHGPFADVSRSSAPGYMVYRAPAHLSPITDAPDVHEIIDFVLTADTFVAVS